MKKSNVRYIVYHYELMNDGRLILLFEPNVFKTVDDAETHCSVLEYLSGRPFSYVPESELTNLELIKDET